jgi:ribonuclease HII
MAAIEDLPEHYELFIHLYNNLNYNIYTHTITVLGINDSKQTKEHEREYMYEVLINHPDVLWSVSVVSHTEIDDVNILQGMYEDLFLSFSEVTS